jgi:hypothetical protein
MYSFSQSGAKSVGQLIRDFGYDASIAGLQANRLRSGEKGAMDHVASKLFRLVAGSHKRCRRYLDNEAYGVEADAISEFNALCPRMSLTTRLSMWWRDVGPSAPRKKRLGSEWLGPFIRDSIDRTLLEAGLAVRLEVERDSLRDDHKAITENIVWNAQLVQILDFLGCLRLNASACAAIDAYIYKRQRYRSDALILNYENLICYPYILMEVVDDHVQIIIWTRHGSIDNAVQSLRETCDHEDLHPTRNKTFFDKLLDLRSIERLVSRRRGLMKLLTVE